MFPKQTFHDANLTPNASETPFFLSHSIKNSSKYLTKDIYENAQHNTAVTAKH